MQRLRLAKYSNIVKLNYTVRQINLVAQAACMHCAMGLTNERAASELFNSTLCRACTDIRLLVACASAHTFGREYTRSLAERGSDECLSASWRLLKLGY